MTHSLHDLADVPGDHTLRPHSGGHSAQLYTVHTDPSQPPYAVLKLPQGKSTKALPEAAALRALAHDPHTPDLLHTHHDPPALLLSWLHPGAGAWDPAPEDAPIARALGTWLRHLHDLRPPPGDLKLSDDPMPLPERLLAQLTHARKRARRRARRDPWPQAEADLARLDRAHTSLSEHPPTPTPRALIHRDLRPANVCVTSEGFVGVVDFERAACAPPAWDFVKLRWWLLDLHPTLQAPFHEGYGPSPPEDDIRAFALFEAATMLAYFAGRHDVYPGECRRQLDASPEERVLWRTRV